MKAYNCRHIFLSNDCKQPLQWSGSKDHGHGRVQNTRLDWTQSKEAIQEEIALLNKGRYTQKKYLHQFSSKNGMRTTRWWVNSKACSIRVHADTQNTFSGYKWNQFPITCLNGSTNHLFMQLIDVVTIYSRVTWFRHISSHGNPNFESKYKSQHA